MIIEAVAKSTSFVAAPRSTSSNEVIAIFSLDGLISYTLVDVLHYQLLVYCICHNVEFVGHF